MALHPDPSFKSSVLQLLEHYAEYRNHHKFAETIVFAAANNQTLGMLVTLDPNAEFAVPEGATFTHLYGRALTSYPVEQFSKSDQSKRDALQQLDDTRQLNDPPSDPSMSSLLDDDKYLTDEHGQPSVAVAATPTASRQRAPSKRKRAAAGASSPSSTHKSADWTQRANSCNRQSHDSPWLSRPQASAKATTTSEGIGCRLLRNCLPPDLPNGRPTVAELQQHQKDQKHEDQALTNHASKAAAGSSGQDTGRPVRLHTPQGEIGRGTQRVWRRNQPAEGRPGSPRHINAETQSDAKAQAQAQAQAGCRQDIHRAGIRTAGSRFCICRTTCWR
ncbi:hypothetical protein BC831DRAFT_437096 [Entophlyctis helioformis]|nr:hypothetical protein BC831DRAFT_437096 [Entophlyctis helioformis]